MTTTNANASTSGESKSNYLEEISCIQNDKYKSTFSQTDHITPEKLKLYDINKKLAVAQRVIIECMDNTINKEHIQENQFFKCALSYKYSSSTLNNAIFDVIDKKQRAKTFCEWFTEQSWEKEESLKNFTTPLDSLLRNTIVNQYVHNGTIPNISSIRDELESNNINLTKEQVKKLLKINGYMMQRLPRTTATIIVENPKKRLAKMNYLFNLIQSEKTGKHIVYVEDKIIMINDDSDSEKNKEVIRVCIAVSSLMGLIVQDVQVMSATSNKAIIVGDWVLNRVLPFLSIPSVIVLEKRADTSSYETPTVGSKRKDMIDWLTRNDVPHSQRMHTAELYELIKRSKRACCFEKYKLDEILKAYGHTVLHRPYPTNYFNIFSSIWDLIAARVSCSPEQHLSQLISHTLSAITAKQWTDIIEAFYNTEEKLYHDTNAVDEVIDKILTYAKHETIPEQELHECDEGIDEIRLSEIVQDE